MASVKDQGSKGNFDPTKHIPPCYDIRGHIKPPKDAVVADTFTNGLNSTDVKIPSSWNGSQPGKTRTTLKQVHKESLVPHPSYDIDGDGMVGERDLLISKMFDSNKDGILDAQEKENAMNNLQKYTKNLRRTNEMKECSLWGLNKHTKNTYYRVGHKKRLCSDFDDHKHYKTLPCTEKAVCNKTMTDLKFNRKKADKAKLEKLKAEWDLRNPSEETRPYIRNEFFVDKPSHTSIIQIKSEKKKEIRKKAGLKEESDFLVSEKPPPTLSYVKKPQAPGKSYLHEQRRHQNFTELRNLEKKQGNIETGIDRLIKKEEAVFSLGHADHRKTKEMVVERRRKEMLNNNMRVFGNVAIGIHGKELPKYHKTMAEWWANKRGFKDKPQENSLLRFKQSTKYWAKDDNILLCDFLPDEPKIDDFKQTHVKQKRKNQVAEGPHKIKRPCKRENFILRDKTQKPIRKYRWTSVEDQFVERNHKFAKEIDKTHAERGDYEPLYSSFNPNGTFHPPPTTFDMLNKQKEYNQKACASATMTNKSMGLRAHTAVPPEESLIGTGNNSINLFTRATTVDAPSMTGGANRSFKASTFKGIRSGAFKQF
ncbi:unnamed protein product [Moneuplotes crassus]|uniref:EF-hand domain-containing protein n=1 Tax=Euplotes crassus TaxID=5936 RepID=A0AAD1X8W1_EUPCR|nr:unnamed protein product [Moneuplotes crassus]